MLIHTNSKLNLEQNNNYVELQQPSTEQILWTLVCYELLKLLAFLDAKYAKQ